MAVIRMGLLLAGSRALVPSGPVRESGNLTPIRSGLALGFGNPALVPSGLALES